MKTINKSVLIWYSPDEMQALVADVARYPEFLPWCDQARILEQSEQGVLAEVGLSIAGIHQTFTTRNDHSEPHAIGMQLVEGPFSQLEGRWVFAPVGTQMERACKVELTLHYSFSNPALGAVIGPVFDKIASSLVDAFVKRAQDIYG